MSTTIDQRVVEMRFDNKHFESNVSNTMSTLDKLKQKLNFSGASKGLEGVNAAAKNVNMAGLGSSVEAVSAKFSALQVMGVTALANITNSAVNAGKRMVSALTIDPIKSGFQEYETQINAVQTILANTQSKGSTIDDVNKALDELNKYADMTIYNFTEMTRNIGTFTAAGVDLETSVNAIQGIANLAAVSGSTSQQASTAMYQLSQALAAGTVKLMDWNSVVNAGMGGEMFQNALKETSELLGTGAEAAIEASGSFRESLKDGWLTSEVLTETLKKFTTSGANERVAEYTGLSKEAVEASLESAKAQYGEAEAIEKASEALAKKSGKNKDEIKSVLQFAATATDAATKVKTFSQLWDVMKESAQSGWSSTWKLIIGDFEEAKNLLTPLADFLTGAIGKMSDARNKLLEGALGKSFKGLAEKIKGITKPMKQAADTVKKVTNTVKDLGEIVDNVIGGKFGNGKERFDALTKAGYNYYEVQNKVNESLGNSYRHSDELIEKQNKLLGIQEKSGEAQKEAAEVSGELNESDKKRIAQLAKLSDAELKALGYTDEQIAAFEELRQTADKLGMSVEDLLANIDQIDGRWLLINSFKNVGQGIVAVFKAMGEAWREIFPPMTSDQPFNIIAGLHKFSTYLTVSEGNADKFKRTFKGVFALLDIIATIVGGPIKIAFKAVTQLLGMFDLNILDVTAAVGDAIVKFRDWLDSTLDFTKVFEKLISFFKKGVKGFNEWKDSLKDSENLPRDIAQSIVNGLGKAITYVGDLIGKLVDYIKSGFSEIPSNLTSGLVGGIWDGIKLVGEVIMELGKIIIQKIKDVLGIHSPSTVFMGIGAMIMAGLILGIQNGLPGVWEAIQGVGTTLISWVKDLDLGTILAGGVSIGSLVGLFKIGKALSVIAGPIESFGDILENTAELIDKAKGVVKSFSKVLNAVAFQIKVEAFKGIATALLMLVGAVVVLSFIDAPSLWKAVSVLMGIATVLGLLAKAIDKMSGKTIDVAKFSGMVLAIGLSMLMLAAVMKILGGMSEPETEAAIAGLSALSTVIILLVAATQLAGKDVDKAGSTLFKIAAAMLVLSIVMKTIAGMTWEDLEKGVAGITALGLIVAGLIWATKLAGGNIDKVGSTIFKISAGLLALSIVAKLIASMSWGDMGKAAVGIVALIGVVTGLIAVTKLAGKDIDKVGSTLFKISAAMLILSITAKLIAGMSWDDMGKAGVGLIALGGIITGLVAATRLAGDKELKRVGTTLLMMSFSIGMLALVSAMLGMVKTEYLVKGIVAVGLLGGVIALMIASTKNAQDCMKNLIVMTIAIVALAAAVAALSMIDTSSLASATIAMSLVMGMFALILKTGSNVQTSIGTLIIMTVAVGLLAGVLWGLSKLDVESNIGNAIALSVLLIAMSAALKILSTIGSTAMQALIGVGLLTLMAVPLLAFVGVLALAQNIQNATANTILLASLATVLTLLLLPLTLVGALAVPAIIGVGLLTAMAIPLLAFVGILALMQNIQNATENTNLLIGLMNTLTSMLVVLAIVGPLALTGVAAMAGLTALIVAIGVLAVGIGALMEKFPALQDFLNTGIPVLEQLANGIGSIIGNLVAGFMSSVAESLPGIGTCLSDFITNAMPFINGVKMVDSTVLEGVGILAAAILALTAANLIEGVASILSFGQSFSSLGTELSMFMMNAMPFILGAQMIDSTMAEGVQALAGIILTLTAANILEGLTSWITGGTSLADFGAELAAFGPYMAQYAQSISGIDSEAVVASANAAKALAEMADAAPKYNGLAQLFAGKTDMATFGQHLNAFGEALKTYSVVVTGIDTEAINTSVVAGKSLAGLADAVPKFNGLAQLFAGETDLAAFGTQLIAFGRALKSYSLVVLGLDTESINISVAAAKSIGEMASSIPNIGGVVSWFTGDNDLITFGVQLIVFGKALKNYSTSVTDIDTGAISSSVTAAKELSNLQGSLGKTGGIVAFFTGDNDLATFGANLVLFGKSLKSYSDTVSGLNVSQMSGATTQLKRLASLAKDVSGTDFGGMKNFANSLKELGKSGVDKFIEAFTDAHTKASKEAKSLIKAITDVMKSNHETFSTQGETLMNKFNSGIAKAKNNASIAFKSAIASILTAIRSHYQAFYDAGSHLVSGFANGINANSYKAAAKAKAMAQAAEKAAKQQLQEHSPSKVGYEIGDFFGIAFVNGIADNVRTAYNISEEMASKARSGLTNAISKINDVINSDMDAQPTIRPVLDLSNIKSNVGKVSGLLNFDSSTPVMANVNAIGASVNQRNQNGANSDVVSAIDKLRKKMDNFGNTTYSIGGITYDGEGEVAKAVETLVRAARTERRV